MIPLRLSIRNFLCYREKVPPLDFDGLHLACLCGSNGHGKSALLDAITWCLWGKARGKSQDDLVSFAADEARVELEFLARDNKYRVIRSHARGGIRRRQGATDLQLQVLSSDNVQPITGNSLRETQAKIEQLVGMDYDTFINSAFLLQGRADEFTNKTPADRKAVLASILGLEIYDRLQARARERLAETRAAADRAGGILHQMQREIEEIGQPSQELAGVAEYLDKLAEQLIEKHREADNLRGQVTEMERRRNELLDLQKRVQGLRLEIAQLESRITATQGRIEEYQELVRQTASIEKGMEQLEQARRRFESLEEARTRFDFLNQERNRLVNAIAAQRARLETQIEQLEHRVKAELTPKAQAEAGLVAQKSETKKLMESLGKEEREIAEQRQRQQTLATRIGEAQTTAERYNTEGQEIRKKLELLNRSDQAEAVCPLCLTPLSSDGCHRLAAAYQAEIEEKRRLYRQNQASLKQLEVEKSNLEQEQSRREQSLARAQQEVQVKLSDLERQIQESQQAQQELEQVNQQLAAAVASLKSEGFAAIEQGQLKEVERQITALGYDEEARRQSLRQIEELRPFQDRQRELSQAVTRLPEEEEALVQARDMLERRHQELAELEEKQRTNEATIVQLPLWKEQLGEAERVLAELEGNQRTAMARRGYLEGQLRRLDELKEGITTNSVQLASLVENQSVYQELVTTFGKQGVQAMLIETVVPRLEEEANILLGRMTDNRMHVKLETQRERRSGKGDPIETLAINVSDELGPRSYEMYSGGEAFRVNLALRIALSKVLAQRMGAPLPTLFIDEGFGTQDAAGRERILDVISAIQGDFDKIIVITHLEDLKEMFPVRIEVQKDKDGSTFWLN
jgi:DNA repair protein SbcC/Rad50